MLELSRRPSPSNCCNKQTMTDTECTGKVYIESPKIKQEEKGHRIRGGRCVLRGGGGGGGQGRSSVAGRLLFDPDKEPEEGKMYTKEGRKKDMEKEKERTLTKEAGT